MLTPEQQQELRGLIQGGNCSRICEFLKQQPTDPSTRKELLKTATIYLREERYNPEDYKDMFEAFVSGESALCLKDQCGALAGAHIAFAEEEEATAMLGEISLMLAGFHIS